MANSKSFPAWALISLVTNGLLLATVALLLLRNESPSNSSRIKITPLPASTTDAQEAADIVSKLESRQQLTYEQWVDLLDKEAKAAVKNKPDRLTVLVGDSLSLWFPPELLPSDRTWLNQGISGETSAGLLKRLNLFEKTEPQAIFLMIGINDLVKGISDQDLLENYQKIVQDLKEAHPKSRIIVQSILPHANKSTNEKRDRLLDISNKRIHDLNQKIAAITQSANVSYLDLQPLFVDNEGYLRSELTTDGLHLSSQGYLVWRSAIQTFSQLELDTSKSES
ncbi:SGNH/GDSL hydrolase family protein [Phormidesmis sp. 146-20]